MIVKGDTYGEFLPRDGVPESAGIARDAARSAAFSAAGGCALFKQTLDTLQPWAEQ